MTWRDFHTLATAGHGGPGLVRCADRSKSRGRLRRRAIASSSRLDAASVSHDGHRRYRNFLHREETARGLDDHVRRLRGRAVPAAAPAGPDRRRVVLSIGSGPGSRPRRGAGRSARPARERQVELLRRADAVAAAAGVQQLVLAADQFLVERRPAARTSSPGYHWFNDWGRDTMIALPGLTLATGRADEAAAILRTVRAATSATGCCRTTSRTSGDADPGYNTVDASLWFVLAIRRHLEATGDLALLRELLPAVREIVDRAHRRDALWYRGGSAGWPAPRRRARRPAHVDGRQGRRLGRDAADRQARRDQCALVQRARDTYRPGWASAGEPDAATYRDLADRARGVVPAPLRRHSRTTTSPMSSTGPMATTAGCARTRSSPSLCPHPLFEGEEAARILSAVGGALATSYGLRTLAPTIPSTAATTAATGSARFGLPPGTGLDLARRRVRRGPPAGPRRPGCGATLLAPFEDHLRDAGLGSISEILEGDPPHVPRGCIAQAWGVGEVLRAWRLVDAAGSAGR